ncbi:MAG: aminomethyl transferase family protein [Phycisphaerae bacterium]|nr:aminomethyl transferase family protein [Phycisphaerae bacterium]
MAHPSPLLDRLRREGAVLTPYGPEGAGVDVVAAVEALDLEYAAVRKFAGLLDQPHRGVIEVAGGDRAEFLNRMLTQELKGLAPFHVRPSFWLNRKGRIDADLRLIELPGRTLFDLDVHAVARAVEGLSSYVITEDVSFRDDTPSTHRLALHGPRSLELLLATTAHAEGDALETLAPRRACVRRCDAIDATFTLFRDDTTGAPGFELIVPTEHAAPLYDLMLGAGRDPEGGAGETRRTSDALGGRVRLRPIGWHAFNVARIEAGTPLYNVDFGPDSLPAQTGVLHDRVSFTKGCYLGQEVVARMHSRGHSRSLLRALGVERVVMPGGPAPDPTQDSRPERVFQPVSGSPVYGAGATPEHLGDPVGAVTSSCVSPLLGSTPICFAQLKPDAAEPGREVRVVADDRLLRATVRSDLASPVAR